MFSLEVQRDLRRIISDLDMWTVSEIVHIMGGKVTAEQVEQFIADPVKEGTLVQFKPGWYKFPGYTEKCHWAYVTVEITRQMHSSISILS